MSATNLPTQQHTVADAANVIPARQVSQDKMSDESSQCGPCADLGLDLIPKGFCRNCQEHLCDLCYMHHYRARPFRDHELQDNQGTVSAQGDVSNTSTTSRDRSSIRLDDNQRDKHDKATHELQDNQGGTVSYGEASKENKPSRDVRLITSKGAQRDKHDKATDTDDLPGARRRFLEREETHNYRKSKTSIRVSNLVLISSAAVVILSISIYMFIASYLAQGGKDSQIKVNVGEDSNEVGDSIVKDNVETTPEVNDGDKYNHIRTSDSQKYSDNPTIQTEEKVKPFDKDSDTSNPARPHESEKKSNDYATRSQDANSADTNSDTFEGDVVTHDHKGFRGSIVDLTDKPLPYNFSNARWKYLGTINVNTSTDEDTHHWINGLAVMDKSTLILTDHENKKIKLINTVTGKILFDLKISFTPWSVTKINTSEIAATFPYAGEIIFFTVTDTLVKQKRKFNINGRGHGIDYYNNELVVTFDDPGRVEIMDMFGKVRMRVQPELSGFPLFKTPHYVKIHHHLGSIFVSDNDNHTVIELGWDGSVKTVYGVGKIRYPNDIEISPLGDALYVCEYTEDRIRSISTRDHTIQTILDRRNGLDSPYSLSFCSEERKLYVGGFFNDEINVFKLMD